MMRHNYNQSRLNPLLGDAFIYIAAPHVRAVVAALGAALILIVALCSWEARRIGLLDNEIAELETRSVSASAEAARARQLTTILARDRAIEDRIARAHRSAVASTNTIAGIGNALPSQTWLTTVAAASTGSWQIAGRSTRVAEIGTTLRAIAAIDTRASTRLQTISATGRTGHVLDFVIGWDMKP